jgi:HEAT repeat protein
MGKDNHAQEFHAALQRLVGDREPIVQRNAATALVAFGDSSGRPVLRSMLQPYSLAAPVTGKVKSVLREGLPVKVGMMLARIQKSDEQIVEVRSPLPGEIQKVIAPAETDVRVGDALTLISPDSATVWEALRALYFVGEGDDISVVEPYTNGVAKMTDEIKQQANLTLNAIQSRSGKAR